MFQSREASSSRERAREPGQPPRLHLTPGLRQRVVLAWSASYPFADSSQLPQHGHGLGNLPRLRRRLNVCHGVS